MDDYFSFETDGMLSDPSLDKSVQLDATKHLIDELEYLETVQDPIEDISPMADAIRAIEQYGDVETALEALDIQRRNLEDELRLL